MTAATSAATSASAPGAADGGWRLEAEKLAFAHPGGPRVFEGVSFAIRANEVVALLGASGCGKSSLLRVLAGLATPAEGRVVINGRSQAGPDPRAALLFQQPGLLPWLRVEDNVAFGLDFRHQPRMAAAARRERVTTALAAVGLTDASRQWPTRLSGGMAQRAALARALAREPLLLFADEPFSALDAITRAGMQALLLDVVARFGTAVLLVTHDIDEALAVADRVLLMAQGRLAAEWTLPPIGPLRQARLAGLRADLHAGLLSGHEAGQAAATTQDPAAPTPVSEAVLP